MSRISDIIAKARATLGDNAGDRWTTDRLLLLIDEAQKDINRQHRILKGETTFGVIDGQREYTLPSDVYILTRATFDDQPIDLVSYGKMDTWVQTLGTSSKNNPRREHHVDYGTDFGPSLNFTWDSDTGTDVAALIIDNRDVTKIRVYPIPDGVAADTYTFTNAGTILFEGDEVMGVVTDIDDYTFTSPYGIVTDFFDATITDETFDSVYGVVTSIGISDGRVRIWYIRRPIAITSVNDTLELSEDYDIAIKHYIVSSAYEDDTDAKSESKSATAFARYERELEQLGRDVTLNNSESGTRTTSYKGAFHD